VRQMAHPHTLSCLKTKVRKEGKRNGAWGPPEQWRAEGGHGRGGRLRVAALVNCRAADRLVNSASPRAAAPGSLAVSADGPPTGAQRQPAAAFVRGTAARACAAGNERHTAGGGGTAAGARRAPPGAGSPLSVSTRARGSPLAGAGCAGACIARRQENTVLVITDPAQPTGHSLKLGWGYECGGGALLPPPRD